MARLRRRTRSRACWCKSICRSPVTTAREANPSTCSAGRLEPLDVARQLEELVRQLLVDDHGIRVHLEDLLAVALALDGERPLHAASDVAVLGKNSHFFEALLRFGVAA